MFTLFEVLKARGFGIDFEKIKMVRHKHSPWDLTELVRRGQFDIYQWVHIKPIFKDCDYVISFLGFGKSKAKLNGIYRITGSTELEQKNWPKEFLYQDMPCGVKHQYFFEKLKQFEDFENRLVIDWGTATRQWGQWLKDKPILEILPEGYIGNFSGYLDFILTFSQLKEMIDYSTSNNVWHQKLSGVGGIYLMLDTKTGKQYIGSASGPEGILGRWRDYAASGHGGNKQLKKLVQGNESYVHNFRYTILQTLPKTITKKEIISFESLYKNKLGSKVFGLNEN